jgi:hypothetical protein
MSRAIRRRRDGRLAVKLPDAGVAMIRDAIASLEPSLGDGSAEQSRLFPRAYIDDTDEARFEELTRGYLIESKREAFRLLIAALDRASIKGGIAELDLDEDEVRALLGSMNDLRLVIGTLLDVTDDEQPRGLLPPDEPAAPQVNAYLWLGAVLEMLVDALLDEIGTGEAGS